MRAAFTEVVGFGNTKRALQMRKVNEIIKEELPKGQPFPIVEVIYEGQSRKEQTGNGGSKIYLNAEVIENILKDESRTRKVIKNLL